MLQYILAGLALGSIYAIASAGLVVTFVSTGVLNFAFGSMAYVVARFYYWLNTQHGWTTTNAGLMSLLVMAPLLGMRPLRGAVPVRPQPVHAGQDRGHHRALGRPSAASPTSSSAPSRSPPPPGWRSRPTGRSTSSVRR